MPNTPKAVRLQPLRIYKVPRRHGLPTALPEYGGMGYPPASSCLQARCPALPKNEKAPPKGGTLFLLCRGQCLLPRNIVKDTRNDFRNVPLSIVRGNLGEIQGADTRTRKNRPVRGQLKVCLPAPVEKLVTATRRRPARNYRNAVARNAADIALPAELLADGSLGTEPCDRKTCDDNREIDFRTSHFLPAFSARATSPPLCTKVRPRLGLPTPLPEYGGRDVLHTGGPATRPGHCRDRFAVFDPDSPLLVTPLPVPGGIREGLL